MNYKPPCKKQNCNVQARVTCSTYVGYIPVYDENGVNTNPNVNKQTARLTCSVCNKVWVAKFDGYTITYEEID